MPAEAPKSKKTTAAGWLILVSGITAAIGFLLDADPTTNPDWSGVVESIRALGIGGTGVFGGLLGLFSRDNNESSEGNKLG